ncbi:MAG: family 20 glycosylhydrolase [Verrucomicrobiota bacterium]
MDKKSGFIELSSPLLPTPQRIETEAVRWEFREGWQRFEGKVGGCPAVAWAADRRDAEALFLKISPPDHASPEAYTAVFEASGAAGCAAGAQGLRQFGQTLAQMRLLSEDDEGVPACRIEDWPDLEIRGTHLDLKYFTHGMEYLHRWVEDLAALKINTLLIEYDDRFPYARYPEIVSPDAPSREELAAFLAHARGLGLRLIPLVQSLGHLEFILRHPGWEHLRAGEDNEWVTETRANSPAALEMVYSLIDEVLELHSEDEWFHVGGDEPFYLKQTFGEDPARLADVFSGHMSAVCRYVVGKGKRPMIHDDAFRSISRENRAMVLERLPANTILTFWKYDSSPPWPTANTLAALDHYESKGFQWLGLPCFNWGNLVPHYADYTLHNTLEMTGLVAMRGALGVINTAWACFRVPLPAADMGLAVTADRTWNVMRVPHSRESERRYCRWRFGLTDRRLADCLYDLGIQVEVATDYGRPASFPSFCYMDCAIQLGSQEARVRVGTVLDLYDNADCVLMARRKMELLNASPQRPAVLEALRCFRAAAAASLQTMKQLRGGVKRGADTYGLLLWIAAFQVHACERWIVLIENDEENQKAALRESDRLRAKMNDAFLFCLPSVEIAREDRYLFEGERALLKTSHCLSAAAA